MKFTITKATQELLTDLYKKGVGPRGATKQIRQQLEEAGTPFDVTMANVKFLWKQLGLDPAKQPKPAKVVEFEFEDFVGKSFSASSFDPNDDEPDTTGTEDTPVDLETAVV